MANPNLTSIFVCNLIGQPETNENRVFEKVVCYMGFDAGNSNLLINHLEIRDGQLRYGDVVNSGVDDFFI